MKAEAIARIRAAEAKANGTPLDSRPWRKLFPGGMVRMLPTGWRGRFARWIAWARSSGW